MWTWALELECAEMDRQRRKKAWMKRRILIPLYIGGRRLYVPTGLVKLAYLPSATINGAVGLPTSVLMGIPEEGEHDLCFDKTCQGNRFAKRAEVV